MKGKRASVDQAIRALREMEALQAGGQRSTGPAARSASAGKRPADGAGSKVV